MSNVVKFYTAENADHVLEQAVGEFDSVFILGFNSKDKDFLEARASGGMLNKDILWAIEEFKHGLLFNDA